MSIKNIVTIFERIGEHILPEMIGGEFTLEEKVLLIENSKMQIKWTAGKKYLKENHSREINKNQNRVGLLLQAKIIAKHGS